MTREIDAVFNAALSLPAVSKAALAEKLLKSLDEERRSDIDAAWAEEAEGRIRAWRAGELKSLPGDAVFDSSGSRKTQ